MYIPKINEEHDQERIFGFIRKNSFGIVVSSDNNIPTATHIPMELDFERESTPILRGHVARVNPHWQLWAENSQVLVIFSGAHSYISSSWYEKENVSTWNYMAVHIYGTIKIVEGEKLFDSLKKLTNKYESFQEKPLYFEQLNEESLRKQMRAIVGFEINIERVEAKAKLSQNRNDNDYKNIINQLHKSTDSQAHEVADEMIKRRHLD